MVIVSGRFDASSITSQILERGRRRTKHAAVRTVPTTIRTATIGADDDVRLLRRFALCHVPREPRAHRLLPRPVRYRLINCR